ncbi:tryptophan--tRNA ligase [bacterium]|nr:tryptophan--tRNA ligase [bacterium]
MGKPVALTGIKPTGTPHIGNYFGAIKPALELANDYDARYFIADYHALNTMKEPKELKRLTFEIAATWLAFGLNPESTLFYRQSRVPQTFELTTFLSAFTPKGFMNRAHAYKAVVAQNTQEERDLDDGVNMGLYTYPILMAADILLFDTDLVPVGKDQKQHIEIAADIAQTINYHYQKEILRVPKPLIQESTELILGLDGRKMSKSYQNVIPLFATSKNLRKTIMKIVTNSQAVEEPKNPEGCTIFTLFKLFSNKIEQDELKERYLAGGMGWGHAKEALFEKMDQFLSPFREKYNQFIQDPSYIEKNLIEGEKKARDIAEKTMTKIRTIAGFY